MKITVFTSNQPRHVALLDALMDGGHEVKAVIEPKASVDEGPEVMLKYWAMVREAEVKTFQQQMDRIIRCPAIVLRPGELRKVHLPPSWLSPENRLVVFSSSYITGALAEHLVRNNCLNLHVGIAPEYRGSAPNFWAEFHRRPELVGAQIQRLGYGLDTGMILWEGKAPDPIGDPFMRGMAACQMGVLAMVGYIGRYPDPSEWGEVKKNDSARKIHYARHDDFTEQVVESYMQRLGEK